MDAFSELRRLTRRGRRPEDDLHVIDIRPAAPSDTSHEAAELYRQLRMNRKLAAGSDYHTRLIVIADELATRVLNGH